MCGICGFLHADGRPIDETLGARMSDLIRHRGPEGSGSYIEQSDGTGSAPTLFLGHRRLKIIDLSEAARQPLCNEDRTVWVILNGEIYNYKALRADLEARGHRFHSSSDTETIVHGYEQYGDDIVRRLDGMFAIALWDQRRRRLIVARDRSGKKPLFHAFDGTSFGFASEIKALLVCPWVKREPATERLTEYLSFGCVRSPSTMFRGIESLPPGSYMVIEDGQPQEPVRYWDLRQSIYTRGATPDAATAEAKLRELLTEAVRARLMSDVPLGALLSGGLDSTIVVGLMAKLTEIPVRTFTIGFSDDPSYDERSHAAIAARAFKTAHTEFVVRTDAAALVEKLLWHHDQPYGDSSAIPTYMVSRLARQHVTVVLNGDGGDEVFGGYERFRAALMAERMPGFVEGLGRVAARVLPRDDGYYGMRRRIERFVSQSGAPIVHRYLGWLGLFDAELIGRLVRPEIAARAGSRAIIPEMAQGAELVNGATLLDRLLYLNFTTYLPDDLHVKVDRMSMAHALEARSPMLDTAVVEYVAGLPPDFKVRGANLKVLLRRAFRDLVPAELLRRRKHGFGVPVDRWFRGELRGMAEDLLLRPDSRIRDLLDTKVVRELLDEHVGGARAHGQRLWTLVNLELWHRMLEDGRLTRPWSDRAAEDWEAEPVARRAEGSGT